MVTEQSPYHAPAAWALQAVRVQVPLQPNRAVSVIQQLGNWKINHVATPPHLARWLYLSLSSLGDVCPRL